MFTLPLDRDHRCCCRLRRCQITVLEIRSRKTFRNHWYASLQHHPASYYLVASDMTSKTLYGHENGQRKLGTDPPPPHPQHPRLLPPLANYYQSIGKFNNCGWRMDRGCTLRISIRTTSMTASTTCTQFYRRIDIDLHNLPIRAFNRRIPVFSHSTVIRPRSGSGWWWGTGRGIIIRSRSCRVVGGMMIMMTIRRYSTCFIARTSISLFLSDKCGKVTYALGLNNNNTSVWANSQS